MRGCVLILVLSLGVGEDGVEGFGGGAVGLVLGSLVEDGGFGFGEELLFGGVVVGGCEGLEAAEGGIALHLDLVLGLVL